MSSDLQKGTLRIAGQAWQCPFGQGAVGFFFSCLFCFVFPLMSGFHISPPSRTQLLMFILPNQPLAIPLSCLPSLHQEMRNIGSTQRLGLSPLFAIFRMVANPFHLKCPSKYTCFFSQSKPPPWNVGTNSINIFTRILEFFPSHVRFLMSRSPLQFSFHKCKNEQALNLSDLHSYTECLFTQKKIPKTLQDTSLIK